MWKRAGLLVGVCGGVRRGGVAVSKFNVVRCGSVTGGEMRRGVVQCGKVVA